MCTLRMNVKFIARVDIEYDAINAMDTAGFSNRICRSEVASAFTDIRNLTSSLNHFVICCTNKNTTVTFHRSYVMAVSCYSCV